MNASANFAHGRVELVVGDIVDQDVDAIVNAANATLAGGGGVDGAIHRAAGPALLEECLKLPEYEPGLRCPTGECRVTGAGRLKVRHIIHAVGPVYNAHREEESAELLRQVHDRALQAAAEHNCRSVALPAISTGAYRFPIEQAAPIALTAVQEFFERPTPVELVRFVLFSQPQYDAFNQAMRELQARRR